MYNHARTLLLNVDGEGRLHRAYPGEELIPSSYRSVSLPRYLELIRLRLFGADPDRTMLNYRAAQLLTLISATELQQYVLDLDPRLTYSSFPRELAQPDTFSPEIRRYSGTDADILTLTGSAITPDTSGRCGYRYQITNDGSQVRIQRLASPSADTAAALALTDGLSPAYSLPYSGYRFHLNTTNPQAAWMISGFLRPQASLASLADNLQSLGEEQLLQLFGVDSVEPYTTFRRCWEQHPEFAYRLGGFLLAAIYRTEELRNG